MSVPARTDPAQAQQTQANPAQTATPGQAALLLDVALRPLFAVLMQRPRSAAELSRSLKISVQKAHYLLGKLMAADIAQLDSVTPRAGRPVKRYRMAAHWFIPFRSTGAETLDAFFSQQLMPRMNQLVRLGVRQFEKTAHTWGYWLEQEGEASSLRIGDPDGAALALMESDEPLLLNLSTLHLRPEHASTLKRRLLAVIDEFDALNEADQPAYTFGLQLVRGEVG
jgi:hypothetical protein